MVTYAFKSDYTPEIPDDESEKLSTTIKLSEVLAAGVRLEASAFSIEAHNAVTALTNSVFHFYLVRRLLVYVPRLIILLVKITP